MKFYQVGGAVRDNLLGLVPKDIDYVVVGATPQQMLALGYEQVGSSFPVFIKNGNEYALARTERKVGVGYTGFETDYNPFVTLEEDLSRRDLTINSMAFDVETNTIIDPYGGQQDLQMKILRHTSDAFGEDPIRVLRTARFAARYGFSVHSDTLNLMQKIAPELKFVPKERIWTEIQKGLMEAHPYKMFQVLKQASVFDVEVMKPYSKPSLAVSRVTEKNDLIVRFGLIAAAFTEADYEEYRIPSHCADVSIMFNKHFDDLVHYELFVPKQRLDILYALKAFSHPELLEKCVEILSFFPGMSPASLILDNVNHIKDKVDSAAIASKWSIGPIIKQQIYNAQLEALKF